MQTNIFIMDKEEYDEIALVLEKLNWVWASGEEISKWHPNFPFILIHNYKEKSEGLCHQTTIGDLRESKTAISVKQFVTKNCSPAVRMFM